MLCPDYHLREARLKIMSGLVLDDLRNHARTFLLEHSLETLFYGNLTITTANKMANSIIAVRRDFLQNYVKQFQNGKGAFTNYVYKIWLFLTTYPPPFTFSMV